MELSELERLTAELRALLVQDQVLDDGYFINLMARFHAFQTGAIGPLARLSALRGVTPLNLEHWEQLPVLPAEAYKHYELYAGPRPPTRTFTSSGTTAGQDRVSRAHYSDDGLRLMDQSVSIMARRMLFPDRLRTRILVLAPPPNLAPTMIMSYGMARLILEFGVTGSRFLLDPRGFDPGKSVWALREAIAENIPVTLIGASFGFVHLLDHMATSGERLALPPGSRTLDAGGFKGRSREVSRDALRHSIAHHLGIEAPFMVNLLGMTELPSQLYDDALSAHLEGRPALLGKRVPPWMRVTVRDPERLHPCPAGQLGLLEFVDLCNIERPLGVLSDDLGLRHEDGSIEIIGRAEDAEARGCSLKFEGFLEGWEDNST